MDHDTLTDAVRRSELGYSRDVYRTRAKPAPLVSAHGAMLLMIAEQSEAMAAASDLRFRQGEAA